MLDLFPSSHTNVQATKRERTQGSKQFGWMELLYRSQEGIGTNKDPRQGQGSLKRIAIFVPFLIFDVPHLIVIKTRIFFMHPIPWIDADMRSSSAESNRNTDQDTRKPGDLPSRGIRSTNVRNLLVRAVPLFVAKEISSITPLERDAAIEEGIRCQTRNSQRRDDEDGACSSSISHLS